MRKKTVRMPAIDFPKKYFLSPQLNNLPTQQVLCQNTDTFSRIQYVPHLKNDQNKNYNSKALFIHFTVSAKISIHT